MGEFLGSPYRGNTEHDSGTSSGGASSGASSGAAASAAARALLYLPFTDCAP